MNIIIGIIVALSLFLIACKADIYLYAGEIKNYRLRILVGLFFILFNLLLLWKIGLQMLWIRHLCAMTLFFVCVPEDIRKKEIPLDFLPVFLMPMLVIILVERDWQNLFLSVMVFLSFWLIAKLSRQAIGYGDAIFLGVLTLILGFEFSLLIFMTALFILGIVSLFLLIIKKVNRHTELPLLPYLAISYFICLFF